MKPLVDYRLLRTPDPPPITAQLYEYVLAGNGLFVRGRREGLTACLPLAPAEVRGLPWLAPGIRLGYPLIPAGAVEKMLDISRSACRDGEIVEALFHLEFQVDVGRWLLHIPPQDGRPGHVRPTETGPGSSFARALVEVHSHHRLPAYFSPTDDADERSGFRIYGVLGSIFTRPVLRLRVGLHGYLWPIPPTDVFELPPGVYTKEKDG